MSAHIQSTFLLPSRGLCKRLPAQRPTTHTVRHMLAHPADGAAALLGVCGGVHADVGVPDEVDVIHRDHHQLPFHTCQVQELAVAVEGLREVISGNTSARK
jgi:hypothetical protein